MQPISATNVVVSAECDGVSDVNAVREFLREFGIPAKTIDEASWADPHGYIRCSLNVYIFPVQLGSESYVSAVRSIKLIFSFVCFILIV